VFSGGYEHVSSQVVAEWIADPTSNYSNSTLVRSKELVSFGFFSLGSPVLTPKQDRLHVFLEGVETHTLEPVTCVYELLPDGEVIEVKSCGSHDT
jgi:hypothetical protein